MAPPVGPAIAAVLGGVTIAFAAAGWALYLDWGATGWPRLDALAREGGAGTAVMTSLGVMMLGMAPLFVAQALAPALPRRIATSERDGPGPTRRRFAEARVQLAVAAILLAAILPYAFGAPEWSWFVAVRTRAPGWLWPAAVSLPTTAAGLQCIRHALRAPAAPAAGP